MNLTEKLGKDYLAAYKAKDSIRLTVLRLLKTAMSNRLVELKNPGGTLSDAEIIALLRKQAKQRKDSIDQYTEAGRQDLADREAAELEILEEYLPARLAPEELEQAVTVAIAETHAQSPTDMGRVIKMVMEKYQGRVDGGAVATLARAKLAGKT